MSIIQGSAMQGATRGFYPKTIEGSLRFNDDDSAYLSWTPDSAGNRKTWTWSGWVKRGGIGSLQGIFGVDDGSVEDQFGFLTDNTLRFYQAGQSTGLVTNAVFRDPSAWYHIVLSMDTTQATASDRTKIYVNGIEQTFTGSDYIAQNHDTEINTTKEHFLGYYANNNSYLDGYMAEVFFIDGTAHDADDFGETKNGVWVPKDITASDFTMGTNGFHLTFEDDTEVEAFNTVLWRGNGGTQSITGMGFQPDFVWIKERSNTSHHHLYDSVRGATLYVASSTTGAEATASTGLTAFNSDGFTVGSNGAVNASGDTYVAWGWDAGANNAVTGHSSVTYTGTGGTQRISGLPFRPDLVWIKNRSEAFSHGLVDSVRGATKVLESDDTETEYTNTGSVLNFDADGFTVGGSDLFGKSGNSFVAWAWDAGDGDPVSNTDGSITSTVKASQANGFSIVTWTGTGSNATIGHGLSSAPDMILLKARTGSTKPWKIGHTGLTSWTYRLHFDTGAEVSEADVWNSTAPTSSVFSTGTDSSVGVDGVNYVAYCFHDVTGKQKFGTYTGTGASGNTVTGLGFRPGWLMVKDIDAGWHWIIKDGSRSPLNPSTESLFASNANAEQDSTLYANFDFDDDGFTINSTDAQENADGHTYIYAAFAGSYSDYITDYNTDGSVDSRVKANDTYGFSIVSWTYNGETNPVTVGHGLTNDTPDFIIFKFRNISSNWAVYHKDLTSGKLLALNTTDAEATSSDIASPNDTTFSSSATGVSGREMIAYCWAEKSGYSKFGSYTGNGSTDGPEVTTGFEPAIVILKNASNTSDWRIYDNTRDTDKIGDKDLYPNSSSAEGSGSNAVQFNSDGFKLIFAGGSGLNTSGDTYIFAAFADTREAAFWLDQSSNDNDWQPNNLDHNDTVADSPTDNFATWNPVFTHGSTYAATLSDGNLTMTKSGGGQGGFISTIGATTGKHYAEITVKALGFTRIGVVADANLNAIGTSEYPIGNSANSVSYTSDTGNVITNSSGSAYGSSYAAGDVIGIAFDADSGKVWFAKNNTWQNSGDPVAGTNPATTLSTGNPFFFGVAGENGFTIEANFGQQPFKYDPPE